VRKIVEKNPKYDFDNLCLGGDFAPGAGAYVDEGSRVKGGAGGIWWGGQRERTDIAQPPRGKVIQL